MRFGCTLVTSSLQPPPANNSHVVSTSVGKILYKLKQLNACFDFIEVTMHFIIHLHK